MKNKLLLITVALTLFLFAIPIKTILAAKSPTPKITEVAGIYTSNMRVHFKINPINSGQIIQVKYKLSTEKFNDVKYKIPKNAKRSGTVSAATSATGSAIDLYNLPENKGNFIYNIKVKIKIPKQTWSSWSNIYMM